MFILEFLLIVFLVAIAIIAFTVWRAWRKVHSVVNQFNEQFGGQGSQQGSAHRQSANGQDSNGQQRTTTTDSGETIIDTRTEEQVNQKIFSKDEGEYVDYKEVK